MTVPGHVIEKELTMLLVGFGNTTVQRDVLWSTVCSNGSHELVNDDSKRSLFYRLHCVFHHRSAAQVVILDVSIAAQGVVLVAPIFIFVNMTRVFLGRLEVSPQTVLCLHESEAESAPWRDRSVSRSQSAS
jgi:hypothetical protein